ncbi:Valine-tRNA ligase [Trinorchestia longiramus]|nr:Valine-tRNA ligase [Trinorchestia longiramus]
MIVKKHYHAVHSSSYHAVHSSSCYAVHSRIGCAVHSSSCINNSHLPELPPMDGPCPVLSLQKKWYPTWESNHYFFRGKTGQQEGQSGKDEPFVVMLPPPNITGSLHLGHALTATLQDILVRWQGMQGRDVLWVPGCDHAGIATQVLLEQHLLQTRGKNRHQLGQNEFLKEAWNWKESKERRIYDQLRKLGVALDWDQAVFTMSESMSRSVAEAFIRLYEKGLIYRKSRPVNYCPALQSVISDIEVDHWKVHGPTEVMVPGHDSPVMFGQMLDVAYPLEPSAGPSSSSSDYIVVSTTRPETIPADTAIMVHPQDNRYAHLVGRRVSNPCLPGHSLPIIADTTVDVSLGTGAVKVTPGLSATDYEVGQRHGLPVLDIMLPDGTLNCSLPALQGMPRLAARSVVTAHLQERGLLRGVRPHEQTVPRCSRTGDVIETLVQKQWFVRIRDMADRSREAVESGELQVHPPSKRHVWTAFMRQTHDKDWCISRQIWWGHRVPVYRISPTDGVPLPSTLDDADEDGDVWVAATSAPEALQKAALKLRRREESLRADQDPDVLDTWFSSALFPFAALGWPECSTRLRRYYPTSVLVTGQDILFFWVARMVMLGTELTGRLPFKTVQLHGLVCDSSGAKMSKSKGNVIDPMALIGDQSDTPVLPRVSLSPSAELNSPSCFAKQFQSSSHIPASSSVSENDAKVLKLEAASTQHEETVLLTSHKSASDGPQLPVVGPDALRMSLMSTSLSSDYVEFGLREVEMFSKLPNKMWQSVRFLRHSCNSTQCCPLQPLQQLPVEMSVLERWALHHTGLLVGACSAALHSCDIAALTRTFAYVWRSVLCDVFLEAVKPIVAESAGAEDLPSGSGNSGTERLPISHAMRSLSVMHECMLTALLCIAPVMPHVAEELYHCLPHVAASEKKESIFLEEYPIPHQWSSWVNETLAIQVDVWLEVVTAVRSLKASHGVSRKDLEATLYSSCPHLTAPSTSIQLSLIASQLAQINRIEIVIGDDSEVGFASSLLSPVGESSVLHLHVPEVDASHQKTCLEKRLRKLAKQLSLALKYERTNLDKIEKLTKELKQAERIKERLEYHAQR